MSAITEFLAAQIDDPGNLALALIHIDWLDERGEDSLAGFLRAAADCGIAGSLVALLNEGSTSVGYALDGFAFADDDGYGNGVGDELDLEGGSGAGDGFGVGDRFDDGEESYGGGLCEDDDTMGMVARVGG